MADNIFEILIKYGLDKTKATEAVAELKKLKDGTSEANKEAERYSKTLEQMQHREHDAKVAAFEAEKALRNKSVASVDLSKTQEQLSKNISASSVATADLSIKKKELLKLAHLLPEPIRAVGTALKFAFSSPLAAPIAVVLVTMRKLIDVFQKAKEKAEALNLARTATDLADVGDAAGETAREWARWAETIKDVSDNSDAALKKTELLAEAAREVSDSQFDLARAKVESDASLSPEQKSTRLAEIGAQKSQASATISQGLRKKQIEIAAGKLASAEANDAVARTPISRAASDAASSLDSTQKEIASIDSRLATYDQIAKTSGLSPDEARERQRLAALRNQLADNIPGLEQGVKSTAGALKSFDDTRASVPALRSNLESLRFADQTRTQTENSVLATSIEAQKIRNRGALNSQFTEAGFGGLSNLMGGAGSASVAIGGGGRAGKDDAQDFNQLIAALALSKAQVKELMSLLMAVFKDGIVTQDEMKQLKNRIQTQKNQQ